MAAGILTAASARAQVERVRLTDLIAEARQHNPDLGAAEARARAAAAVPARVVALDDPVLSYEAWNAPESLRLDRADNNIFRLSQKIPFPGKRALAEEVATRDAEMATKDARGTELDVVASITKAYYELWRIHRLIAVYSREKDLAQRVARIAEQKYGTSEVSQSDVLRAQVELTHLINRVHTETLSVRSAEAELRELLSRPGTDPFGIPEDPSPPRLTARLEDVTDVALAERPEIAAQRAAVSREEAAVRLSERARLPDFEFSVGRFENAHGRDGFGAMASVTLPIAQPGKYDAGVTEANARLSAQKADLRRAEDRIRREVGQTFVRAETALSQYELFTTTHIPQAEQALSVTESGYQTGAVDFLSLIDSLRQIEMVHTEHIEAQVEFEKAYADLERAVGRELPRPADAHGKGTPRHG
ncbi:MAG: TolC family protein [Deltaproteobacteria bacterium]|nr:TolC family protein [Deltaproteobacteria bacterium]